MGDFQWPNILHDRFYIQTLSIDFVFYITRVLLFIFFRSTKKYSEIDFVSTCCHYSEVTWRPWRLETPVTGLSVWNTFSGWQHETFKFIQIKPLFNRVFFVITQPLVWDILTTNIVEASREILKWSKSNMDQRPLLGQKTVAHFNQAYGMICLLVMLIGVSVSQASGYIGWMRASGVWVRHTGVGRTEVRADVIEQNTCFPGELMLNVI